MSWRFTPTERLLRWLWGCLLGSLLSWGAAAQTLESVLAPGPVIKGHAKVENDCKACHVRFDRAAQDGLCMDCHKDVGQDIRAKSGFHGRQKPQVCRSCHTDHRGREAKIVEFDPKKFDHKQSDYPLLHKHAKVECEKCHLPGKRWREAPSDCNACHKKDDVHKGGLGVKCADCHTERSWKEVDFDHGKKTRFALEGKHADAKCDACHKNGQYKDTARTCIGCHKKDDDQKGHKGQYGEKCETCHGVSKWKPSTFRHDVDTRYVLKGKHVNAKCGDCHTGPLYRTKTSTECWDCHKKDDKHKETLGKDCASCHTERSWKEPPRFDHEKTRFPLLGRHRDAECKDCHKDALYRETPSTCIACHKKDDKHKATLGEACADCHGERDWKTTTGRFDHQRTQFPLRNAHAAQKVKCADCHADLTKMRKTPTDCYSCHKKDDKHEGTLGKDCAACHGDRDWKVGAFDHNRTRFALLGRHVSVKCQDCHTTPRFKDAPSDCYSCHKKDDKHKLRFGTACENCHNARAWPVWRYDHTRQARYELDGKHAKAACESCHTAPAPQGKSAAPVPRTCVGCHRSDDVHDGGFGNRCEQCHVTDGWKQIRQRRSSLGPNFVASLSNGHLAHLITKGAP